MNMMLREFLDETNRKHQQLIHILLDSPEIGYMVKQIALRQGCEYLIAFDPAARTILLDEEAFSVTDRTFLLFYVLHVYRLDRLCKGQKVERIPSREVLRRMTAAGKELFRTPFPDVGDRQALRRERIALSQQHPALAARIPPAGKGKGHGFVLDLSKPSG
jgi:hypothetical protein